MSHGTQLDLFKPPNIIEELKKTLRSCANQISEMHSFSQEQQKALSRLYLDLKLETEKHSARLSKIEKWKSLS